VVTVSENVAGGGSKTFKFTIDVSCSAPGGGTTANPRHPQGPNNGSPTRIVGATQIVGVDGVHLVLNDGEALGAPRGGAAFSAQGHAGVNRLELRSSSSHAGTVAFDLTSTAKLVAGSLRVLNGNAVSLGDRTVVFRLSGTAGESAAFTFELTP
jgi:hypothetical protein